MGVGLRERKSAKIKLDILIASKQLVGKGSFAELYVDDICEKAGVSKVTFFKYFPQKDDVLLYYLRIWCLERAVDLHHSPKEGLEAVYFLFDQMADTIDRNPGLILSLISYYMGLNRPPSPFPLRAVERQLLYPNEESLSKIEILSIPQMMEKFVLEAIFHKEITAMSDTTELANLFVSILYGSIVRSHMAQIKPLKMFFRKNIDTVLRGLN
ncbi:TetR/AcrR family transcriptional regulator [Fulvivirga sediminis]|uniref:TetR/AcrR family transcriptional regulator n=1 Tax=Fulvivirga sediminis TaxID=2803949 RepID=A0A937FDE3_9BACT|nr:TetR/AcrR family transcriptional regulator [Fulvivirga sediminis]MBL3658368.1 TetR/AcrR family transcriptional regulator [Fulvivirga sediminis]